MWMSLKPSLMTSTFHPKKQNKTCEFVPEPIFSLCASGLDIFIGANTSFFHLHLSGNTAATSVKVLGPRSSERRHKEQRQYEIYEAAFISGDSKKKN